MRFINRTEGPKMTKTDFEGITVANCCHECNVNGCVISGKPYCAHPRKGGLHAAEQQNPETLKRYRSAAAILDRAAAEDKLKRAAEMIED
jgi:hypothetical protein